MEKNLGKHGENLAADHLSRSGYRILVQNYRVLPFGEIDIVARAKDGTLVFVEVKTLKNGNGELDSTGLMPEDNVSKAKLTKMKRAAEMFLARNPDVAEKSPSWQIDVIALKLDDSNAIQIQHYENV